MGRNIEIGIVPDPSERLFLPFEVEFRKYLQRDRVPPALSVLGNVNIFPPRFRSHGQYVWFNHSVLYPHVLYVD